jgi:stress-induced morphogen
MRRPIVGIALGIIALGLAACSNGAGQGGGGAGGRSGGATSAGTTTGASNTGGATSARTAAGATSTIGTIGGATSTSSATGGASSAGSTTGTSSATGGSTEVSTSGGNASGGAAGGATDDSRPDAGADATVDGASESPDAGRNESATRDVSSDASVGFDTAADSATDALVSNCTCLGKPAPACTPTGNISYTLSQAASPSADQADAYKTITCAMDMAVAYYNCYSNITGSVRVSYDTGVATADGNINGSIRFGAGRQYMTCATSMHEIAHTQGIGTASQWASHVSGGFFVGTNAAAQLQAINATLAKPLYTELHADSMHFWPYGLNYDTEATGADILVDHCQMVVAIRKDLGLQP